MILWTYNGVRPNGTCRNCDSRRLLGNEMDDTTSLPTRTLRRLSEKVSVIRLYVSVTAFLYICA